MSMTAHLFSAAFVLLDHLLGLFSLVLVVRRFGSIKFLLALLFGLLHLLFSLAHRP